VGWLSITFEAPAEHVDALSDALLEAGATVTAFDPEAIVETKRILGDRIRYADHAIAACEGADGLILVTEWSEFRRPDFARMQKLMRSPVVFDGRNLFTPEQMKQNGFIYYSIGRH